MFGRTLREQLHLTSMLPYEHEQHTVCVRPMKTGRIFRFHP